MILAVKNGQLIPPRTPSEGRTRAFKLAAECARIKAQLSAPPPDTVTRGGRDYRDWRDAAERALTLHNLELRLLSEWLEETQQRTMLRRALALLNTLAGDGCDFTKEEIDFVKELNTFVTETKTGERKDGPEG